MKVEVLISCMFQKDVQALIKRTNIQSDVLVINQCDEDKSESFEFQNIQGTTCKVRIIHTTERGLSRSRNMALRNASGDLCLICDDDEILENNYPDLIHKAFKEYPECSIITFRVNIPNRIFPLKSHRVWLLNSGRIGSVQICIKRNDLNLSVSFCEMMGSGTGNGPGEESKFIVDCLKKGFKIRFVPSLIGTVAQNESQWFQGYNEKYWIDRGWVAKMIYGYCVGYVFLWYTLFLRCRKLDNGNKWIDIMKWMHKGFFENRQTE